MFNLAEFIKTNLIRGFKDGSFSEVQINIFALNYMNKGQITQEDFEYILNEIELIKNPPEETEEEIIENIEK